MRLRYCACGAPVVLVGGRWENDRPTGTVHVCTQALLDCTVTVSLADPEVHV